MNRILKTFLLWLLIAALPLQGMAAIIKASCGPRHHSLSPVTMSVVEHHHDGSAAPHEHVNVIADGTTVDFEVANKTDSKSADGEPVHKTSYCSACAACCTGAVAPPPAVSLNPAFIAVEATVIPPVDSFIGFIPAGLERPPRPVSV
jgi:hypothetical protein